MDKELLKGSLDLLLLSLISKEDQYGYDLAKKIKAFSNDLYEIGEGTLYPALKRLESKKAIESYWGASDTGGRRKYYRLTKEGSRLLESKMSEWNFLHQLIELCYREG
ncbi:PadR family transcriptional regulator [Alicyclobacillus acidoterrestris]|uniref:PadR family transcriptional regulator n=1 Tax=Alicyclobacillus suci TaxID=2816080 RepID=UPI001191263E|nr:helix-turn-helix transcriptional regulator [Alicyclobacillus suci]GEO24988.1 PadR family transcriptional regulator [Alicyclobacillus acidoterrestris]